jgi:hypothetical protein
MAALTYWQAGQRSRGPRGREDLGRRETAGVIKQQGQPRALLDLG